ncbi:MAG TPA: hypothetical protein VFT81_03065 [Dermatophilaceae bacterium]|nr:hypothetical protein [Dermatophilaceae bacterium]
MKAHVHLSELLADDLLLDRVAARHDPGSEPVAALLAALARHADTPLRPARSARRFRRHRALTAMAVLVVGASGVGAAAAVTQPGRVWPSRDSLRMTDLEAGAATAPSVPPVPPAPVPAPTATAGAPRAANGAYTLIRDAAGRIVLAPSGVVEARGRVASTQQAAQAPAAAPGTAQPRAGSIHSANEPHLSFFLATDPDSVGAGKPRLDAPPGTVRPRTPDNSGGGPTDETMTPATTAPQPTPTPTLSAGKGDSSGRSLPGADERSTPAAGHLPLAASTTDPVVPDERQEAGTPAFVPSEPPTDPPAASRPPEAPAPDTSTSAKQEQPPQEVDEADAGAEALPTEPVS